VGSTKSVFKALRGLAKLLEIEAPRQWLQEDRASKRAVFRVKRDGGRDGPPLDLQSILNRAAKAGLEKTLVKKKPGQWVFLGFLYICPEERVFRVFSVSRILLGASRL
jgi:hypothetical protein